MEGDKSGNEHVGERMIRHGNNRRSNGGASFVRTSGIDEIPGADRVAIPSDHDHEWPPGSVESKEYFEPSDVDRVNLPYNLLPNGGLGF